MTQLDEPGGLRLMVFDRTCRGGFLRPGLSHAWRAGAHLYRWMRRFDAWAGVASWPEALHFLAKTQPGRAIAEVQYWGHGKWGYARIGDQQLGVSALARHHTWARDLAQVRARMLPAERGLWWFRTCETFGAQAGHRFAREFTEFMRCRTAGHTYVIGHWQSGLHTLRPGEAPTWAEDEALLEGCPRDPKRAKWSGRSEPNTVGCLRGAIPAGY